ncbi:MAG TPA: hypothetical protein DDX06_01050 [Curvibacter sp.]|nr:hypothetical protein [Curvibacter sp.]
MKNVANIALIALAWLVAIASFYALWNWPLWWLLGAAVLFTATSILFGKLMNLRYVIYLMRQNPAGPQDLPRGPRYFAAVLLAVGYVFDYLLNAAVFTVILFIPPMELTVTDRLNAYGREDSWAGRVSRYFARDWINPEDHTANAEGTPHVDIGEEPSNV